MALAKERAKKFEHLKKYLQIVQAKPSGPRELMAFLEGALMLSEVV
jgi:hypothetical protein